MISINWVTQSHKMMNCLLVLICGVRLFPLRQLPIVCCNLPTELITLSHNTVCLNVINFIGRSRQTIDNHLRRKSLLKSNWRTVSPKFSHDSWVVLRFSSSLRSLIRNLVFNYYIYFQESHSTNAFITIQYQNRLCIVLRFLIFCLPDLIPPPSFSVLELAE